MRDLLDRISELSGYALSDGRRLPGGEQGGAVVARSQVGPVVVKIQPDPAKAAQVLAAADVVMSTQLKWSVADWLAAGPIGVGAFHLQEFVPGTLLDVSEPTEIDAVTSANTRQTGLAVPGARDHSAQLVAVTTDQHPWFSDVARRSEPGLRFATAARQLVATSGTSSLPNEDLVHGDLSASNIIISAAGEPRFIDAETVGRGLRAQDLADLYGQCVISGRTPDTAIVRLAASGISSSSRAAFVTCVAGVALNNLAWHAEHRAPAEFDRMCARTNEVLGRVERDCDTARAL